eukprot:9478389-Pyramimonas_sp.AAC.1
MALARPDVAVSGAKCHYAYKAPPLRDAWAGRGRGARKSDARQLQRAELLPATGCGQRRSPGRGPTTCTTAQSRSYVFNDQSLN